MAFDVGMLLAAAVTAEYVLISPPKYLEAWKGYVEMRQTNHSDVSFSVTNSFDVYDAYPFPGWMKDGTAMEPVCSNAAESIYHYIRDRWNPDKRQYYVLGGPWINGGIARASFQRNAGLFAIAREGCLSGLQRGS